MDIQWRFFFFFTSEDESARLDSVRLARLRDGSFGLGSAGDGSFGLGSAGLGSAWLGSARFGRLRDGSVRLVLRPSAGSESDPPGFTQEGGNPPESRKIKESLFVCLPILSGQGSGKVRLELVVKEFSSFLCPNERNMSLQSEMGRRAAS